MNYPHLLSPIKIGSLELKNRLTMAPMLSAHASQTGEVTDEMIEYFVARAVGGYSLITSDFICVEHDGRVNNNQPMLDSDEYIEGFKRLTAAIHKAGGKMSAQLQHGGRFAGADGVDPIGPSPFPAYAGQRGARIFSTEEVYKLIQDFIDAAERAKKADFDMVQIHATHGYLLNEFLSPRGNRRTDEFGGSIQGRAKVVIEIIKGIKERLGKDFPVEVRINPSETQSDGTLADGMEKDEMVAVAMLLEEAGADSISISCGLHGSGIAPAARGIGYNVEAAAELKRVLHIPVTVAGLVHDPVFAESIVMAGKADIIALGRQSLADAEYPNKLASGKEHEIMHCAACVQRCANINTYGFHDGIAVSCMFNPFSSREKCWPVIPAETPKKIVVVGAGPAGLETAWITARRGHKVVLFEKDNMPGGQLKYACIPPFKHGLANGVRYFTEMCKKYGVDLRFSTEASVDTIMAEQPDTVVVATGAKPVKPPIEGIDGENVLFAIDALYGAKLNGTNILVLGAGSTGAETADHLGQFHYKVTIMDMLSEIAADEPPKNREFLLKRLDAEGAEFIPGARVTKIHSDGVTYISGDQEYTIGGFDNILLALGTRSYNPLGDELKAKGVEVHVIGDAEKASNCLDAVYHGAKLGLAL